MPIGKLIRQKFITREDLRANPDTLYVFGDNMLRVGMGGQAGHMRGEPNALGIPTKYIPNSRPGAFFTERSINEPAVREAYVSAIARMMEQIMSGKNVVIPADGIGTGLSRLDEVAPNLLASINHIFDALERIGEAESHA